MTGGVARNLWWGVGIDINVFGNIERCYFCDKWKMQPFYTKNLFFPKPMGGFNPRKTPLAMPVVMTTLKSGSTCKDQK